MSTSIDQAFIKQFERLPKLYGRGEHGWMKTSSGHRAKTDFEV